MKSVVRVTSFVAATVLVSAMAFGMSDVRRTGDATEPKSTDRVVAVADGDLPSEDRTTVIELRDESRGVSTVIRGARSPRTL